MDRRFFVDAQGPRDPAAELRATLKGILDQDAQVICHFPARVKWLNDKLELKLKEPFAPCKELNEWKKSLDPSGLSIVMPASSLESSLAAYSHTFLKLQSKKYPKRSTLNTAISFAASFDPREPLYELALKGVFGGYMGRFGTPGYYGEVEHYGYADSRDIFEYPLNLTMSEIDQLLNHLWELHNYGVRYYFLTENCSYYVLTLIDVARPGLNLRDRFHGVVLPQETLQEVVRNTNLVSEIISIPSKETKRIRSRELLAPSERALYNDLIQNPQNFSEIWERSSPSFSPSSRVKVLEAYNLALIQLKPAQFEEIRLHVLQERAELRLPSALSDDLVPVSEAPHLGHGSYTFGGGLGSENGEVYGSLRYRLSLQDFLSSAVGHDKNAEIEILDLQVRSQNNEIDLKELIFFEIFSLKPMERGLHKLSWMSRSLIERRPLGDSIRNVLVNDGGYGAAVQIGAVTSYSMLTLNSSLDSHYDEGYQLGVGALFGARWPISDTWVLHGEIWPKRFGLGQTESVIDAKAGASFTVNQDWEVRATANARGSLTDYETQLLYFF